MYAGFQVGAVSEERYKKTQLVQEQLKEGIAILKGVSKHFQTWRQLLQLSPSTNLEKKTYFYY